jgi:cytochrome oxidase assembly protein ShyY1
MVSLLITLLFLVLFWLQERAWQKRREARARSIATLEQTYRYLATYAPELLTARDAGAQKQQNTPPRR